MHLKIRGLQYSICALPKTLIIIKNKSDKMCLFRKLFISFVLQAGNK